MVRGVLAAVFPMALVTYALTALVCVPVIFVSARFGAFSPAVVYLTAVVCIALVVAYTFAIKSDLAIPAVVVGAVGAVIGLQVAAII